MFSIIIPLYNKSSYVEECIQSVLNQTFRHYELIVVNDGSTDDGVEKVQNIIDGFGEKGEVQDTNEENITNKNALNFDNQLSNYQFPDEIPIHLDRFSKIKNDTNSLFSNTLSKNILQSIGYAPKLVSSQCKISLINQPNLGVSSARNKGVNAAKYDYIAFLDADDWWDKHFLEEMKYLIEKFPAAALYGCNYFYLKNGKNWIEDKGLPKGFTSDYIDYISLYASKFVVLINCSFSVVRKEAFLLERGFNPHLKFGEDFDLWLRLAIKHKVAYLNKPLAWSNQDSEKSNRAIGSLKIYHPSENVIFNLGYMTQKESEIKELKTLVDGLRVRLLVNYYLMGVFKDKVREELNKVNFSKQAFYYIFIYKGPLFLVRFFFFMRRSGSKVKQTLFRTFLRYNRINWIRPITQDR